MPLPQSQSKTTPTCTGGQVVYGVGGRFVPTAGYGMLSATYPSGVSGAAVTSGTATYATVTLTSAVHGTAGTLEVWAFCGNP